VRISINECIDKDNDPRMSGQEMDAPHQNMHNGSILPGRQRHSACAEKKSEQKLVASLAKLLSFQAMMGLLSATRTYNTKDF